MASFEEKHTLATRYAAWVMRNRMLVILVVLISTVLAALQIKNLDIRNEGMRIGGEVVYTDATVPVKYPYTVEIVGYVPAGDASHARRAFEFLHPLLRMRETDRAGDVVVHRIVDRGAEAPVQLGRIALHVHDRPGGREGRHVAGGVPGGPGGQLVLLQQHAIGPARLGEVIERRGAHGAAEGLGDLESEARLARCRRTDDHEQRRPFVWAHGCEGSVADRVSARK